MRITLALVVLAALAGCVGHDGSLGGDACPAAAPVVAKDIAVPNLAGGGRVGETDSYAVPIDLAAELPGVDFRCVRAVRATLAWTNTADSGADLYVGLEAPAMDLEETGHDGQQLVADGSHTETVTASLGWGPRQPFLLSSGITVVVYCDWASLSGNGLPAQLSVELLV